MAYIYCNNKPYYYNGSKVFPCEIKADAIKVDFNNPVRNFKGKITCLYTDDEIKKKLGIFFVDSWDEEKNKVIKKTNKVVSSIPVRK